MKHIGTIEKLQKNRDGTTSYRLYVSIEGKRYKKTVRCKSKKEADNAILDFYNDCNAKLVGIDSRIAFDDLCERWFDSYARNNYKQSSLDSSRRWLDNRVLGTFDKPAVAVTRSDVQKFINSLSDLSPKSVKNVYSLLCTVFTWAIKKELLKETPCKYIDLPKQKKSEPIYLKKDDISRVLSALDKEPLKYKTALYMALFCGLRKGEVLGLTWSAVDLDKGTYRIKNNRQIIRGKVYNESPKTKAGNRRGAIPAIALDTLKELKEFEEVCREGYDDRYTDNDFIIKHEDGVPISPSTLGKWIIKFRNKYNLPPFSMHSLRHTHASLMVYLGANLEEVQKKLGHSDKATTSNIYVHLLDDFEEVDKKNAEKIDDFIKKGTL